MEQRDVRKNKTSWETLEVKVNQEWKDIRTEMKRTTWDLMVRGPKNPRTGKRVAPLH
jgi:hypothetical protein